MCEIFCTFCAIFVLCKFAFGNCSIIEAFGFYPKEKRTFRFATQEELDSFTKDERKDYFKKYEEHLEWVQNNWW